MALLLFSPVARAEVERPASPPPSTAARTDGIVLGIHLGGGGCPDCPIDEPNGSFELRLAYRLPVGLALGGYGLVVGTQSEVCTVPEGSDVGTCGKEGYQVAFLAAEIRWYPLAGEWFDPYVGLGVATASAGYEGQDPDTTGVALVPRFGAVAIFSNHLSLGLTAARTFASWDGKDVGDAWLAAIEFTVRIWGP